MRNGVNAIFRNRFLPLVVFVISLCIAGAGVGEPAGGSQQSIRLDEPESSPYQGMSLDELLTMPLAVGTLTKDAVKRAPVSVSIITASDIEMTPARTILDLMEVYVPGFTYVNHFNGPRLGMRGIMGDQNHSFLMLVNGRNVSLKTNDGFSREILMRDLNDIERIEKSIRGNGAC